MLCHRCFACHPSIGGEHVMGNKNNPVIMREDMDLFERIAKHGFIDMDYVYLFCYPDKKKRTVMDRIVQLAKHGYLVVNKTFIPPDYTTSYKAGYKIISLGKQGLHLLESMGYDIIDNIKTIQNSSPYRMYHQVQVSTVCDILQKYYEDGKSNWKLDKIYNEREAYHEEALNQPDAIQIFRLKDNEAAPAAIVFLEIERSYASQRSLDRKIKGYSFAIHRKLYPSAFSLRVYDQRVLFVAQTQNQKKALLNKIVNREKTADFALLVAGYGEVTNDPLESIYTNPRDLENKYKLLGKLP